MVKEYSDEVETNDLRTLGPHESVHIRTLVCDILGYAGPPATYSLLIEQSATEDKERGQHVINHTLTRLEVRFPEQIANESFRLQTIFEITVYDNFGPSEMFYLDVRIVPVTLQWSESAARV